MAGLFSSGKSKSGAASGTSRTTSKPARAASRQPTARESNQAKEAIQAIIAVADFGLASILPGVWSPPRFDISTEPPVLIDRGDTLDEDESKALAEGIYGELVIHPAAILHLARLAESGNAHARLAKAVLLVAFPRLARRGVIPPHVAEKVTMWLTLGIMADAFKDDEDAVHMATGGAHGGVGTDGTGQEHDGIVASDKLSKILRRAPDQARKAGEENRVPWGGAGNGERARHDQSGSELEEDQGFLGEPSPGSVGGETQILREVRQSA